MKKTPKRAYRMRERARSQDETRQRIVEATMQLHQEIGPRATTISAIAERAGVQRLTVYRHFPDETAVFQACTAHWLSLNPPPDPAAWSGIDDGLGRARAAVEAFHDYYRATARMWSVAHRDEAEVAALQAPMARFREFVAGVADDLLRGLAPSKAGRPALAATLRHALAFTTWESLQSVAGSLGRVAQVDLVVGWIAGVRAAD